jgi:hypothetical protein
MDLKGINGLNGACGSEFSGKSEAYLPKDLTACNEVQIDMRDGQSGVKTGRKGSELPTAGVRVTFSNISYEVSFMLAASGMHFKV